MEGEGYSRSSGKFCTRNEGDSGWSWSGCKSYKNVILFKPGDGRGRVEGFALDVLYLEIWWIAFESVDLRELS